MKLTRLFDLLENQLLSIPQKVCIAYKYNVTWKLFSTADVNSIVNNLSLGLLSAGIIKGDSEDPALPWEILSRSRKAKDSELGNIRTLELIY